MQTGSNFRPFLEAEHARFSRLSDVGNRDAAIARGSWERAEAAVAHNNWPTETQADEAWCIADNAREAFRLRHQQAAMLRDMTAGLEVDLDYEPEEDEDDYDFI